MADRGELFLSNIISCRYLLLIISFFTGIQTQHGLEVLAFPEQPVKELSNLELQVPCIFCDREFPNTTGKNDAVLHHLLVEHQLVIGDVAQVCDLRRYVLIQRY